MALSYSFNPSPGIAYTFSIDAVALRFRDESAVQQLSQHFFHRILTDDEYVLLVGADPGDDVGIAPNPRADVPYPHLSVMLTKPVVVRSGVLRVCQFSCVISRNQQGMLRVEIPLVVVPSRLERQGLGSFLLAAHVMSAQRLGIGRIEGHADGRMHLSRQYNGYYTLPRLGFDGALTAVQQQQLPLPFAHMRRVSELMQTPAGRDWWRANGSDLDVFFDTTRLAFDACPPKLLGKRMELSASRRTTSQASCAFVPSLAPLEAYRVAVVIDLQAPGSHCKRRAQKHPALAHAHPKQDGAVDRRPAPNPSILP